MVLPSKVPVDILSITRGDIRSSYEMGCMLWPSKVPVNGVFYALAVVSRLKVCWEKNKREIETVNE